MENWGDYDLTEHARESLRKRSVIRKEWVEHVVRYPERVNIDAVDSTLEHRLGRISEYEGRVVRVIVKKDTNPLRIITFYFDRRMRRQL
jgi:hypothetical protein